MATNGLAGKSYSGVRRYAPVKPVAAGSGNGNSGNGDGKPSNGAQATTGALDIPATGTYYFTRDTDIKKEPKQTSNLLLFLQG